MPSSTKTITPFARQIESPLIKNKIKVLQINLGRKCNLACTHCHVEASPKRTEELSAEICQQLVELIYDLMHIDLDVMGSPLWGTPRTNPQTP